MSLFKWMKGGSTQRRSRTSTDAQTQTACFEQLEPRILLSADVSPFHDIQAFDTEAEQVIYVDLEPGLGTAETQSDSEAVGRSDSETVGRSDSPTVEQSNGLSLSQIEAAAKLSITQQNEIQSSPANASEDSTSFHPSPFTLHPSLLGPAQDRGPPTEIVFVESSLNHDLQLKNAYLDDVVVSVLPDDSHGIQFISNTLSQYNNLSAIHIVSHGASGQVFLGNDVLDLASLDYHSESIAAWGNALTQAGDILFYGCEIAGSTSGVALVDRLAELSAAHVAASSDLTGGARLGGDWDLEYRVGRIEAELVLDVSGFDSLLAEVTPIVSGGGSSDVTVDLELTYDGITESVYDVPEVYVRTSAAGVLQYGTDGSSYTDVDDGSGGLVAANYASLSIELTFWLEATDGEYSRLLWNLDETIVTRLHVGDFHAPGVDLSMDALRIEVESGATVSTRDLATSVTDHLNGASDGNSGDLSLTAKSIIVESGAQLLTHVDSGSYTAGDLTMTAHSGIDNISSFFAMLPFIPEVVFTRAFVDLTDATIKTGAMTIENEADSADLFDDENDDDDVALTTVEDAFSLFTSLSVMAGFARTDARAEVTISGGSITADSLTATALADTESTVTVLGFFLGFGMTEIYPTAKITIEGGATIATTGDVSLTTTANGVSSVNTFTNLKYAVAVSLALGEYQAVTSLSSDSSITAGGTVALNALATKSMYLEARAVAGQQGRVGLAIGYSQANATVDLLLIAPGSGGAW